VPVIMVSAVGELDSVVKCIEMGAEDYLPKPINPVLLKARISSSLEKKRLRDQQRELIRKFATKEVAEDLEGRALAWAASLSRHGDVLGHPRLYHHLRVAAARRHHRAAERLLHADDGCHQWRAGRGESDRRRRLDGHLWRAAALRRPLPACSDGRVAGLRFCAYSTSANVPKEFLRIQPTGW